MPVLGLYCCVQAFSSCSAWASHCCGFSCCGVQTLGMRPSELWHVGSVVLAHGLSSCTMWYLPVPETELMFPAIDRQIFHH